MITLIYHINPADSADYNRHDSDLIPMDFTDYCPITGNSLDHSHATAKRLSVNRYHNPPIISLENEAALKNLIFNKGFKSTNHRILKIA